MRGFADKFSDIDIIVLIAGKNKVLREQLRALGSSTTRRFGIDVDMEARFFEDFRRQRWDEIDRWEFSKAEVVFDPGGIVKELLKQKLKVPKDFWVKRVAECAEYLKWYCCPPSEGVATVAEAWVDRGDLLSAHYCLNYAVDLMLELMFALNKEHLPAPKWRLFYSCSLKWLPKDYRRLIEEAMKTEEFTMEEFDRRLKAIHKIWASTLPKIRAVTGLSMDQLSKYFVEKILHLSG